MEVILRYPIWLISAFVIGASIGSFLNVVIYRVPRGGSVSNPKRSYCPHCKKEIPWYRNIPVFTWILQRGKCAECSAPIAFRYVFVEILTGLLFVAAWYVFVTAAVAPFVVAAGLVMLICVLLVSISFIDAEHMVIPMMFCWWGMAIGLIGNTIHPHLVMLGREGIFPWWRGGTEALLGLAVGWGVLALVVRLGKVFLGEKRMTFDQSEEWHLREPENDQEELSFVLGEEQIGWSELFCRKNDRIEIKGHGILLDGKRTRAAEIVIYRDYALLSEKRHSIEELKSLSGKADKIVIPREAMGAGDPPLLGMIGAFIGWQGVFFGLFAACLYALVAAVLGRIGFGRALPFGPFLALGGLTWIFGGWMLWDWYFSTLGGFGPVGWGGVGE